MTLIKKRLLNNSAYFSLRILFAHVWISQFTSLTWRDLAATCVFQVSVRADHGPNTNRVHGGYSRVPLQQIFELHGCFAPQRFIISWTCLDSFRYSVMGAAMTVTPEVLKNNRSRVFFPFIFLILSLKSRNCWLFMSQSSEIKWLTVHGLTPFFSMCNFISAGYPHETDGVEKHI